MCKTIMSYCFFIFLTFITSAANARYYEGYPPDGCCYGCGYSVVYSEPCCQVRVEIRSTAPYRHAANGTGETIEYRWVDD